MPPAARKSVPQRTRKPVFIETIGAADFGGGEGRIKMLVLGDPDSGKTRFSSAFPRPLYLACEPTVGASIVSRRIAYNDGITAPRIVRINEADRPSDAMLDTLDYLEELPRKNRGSGAPVPVGTVILDTADGYSRLLKDEWADRESAAMFTGRDAWGFLEAKFSLTMTRLMNLPYNVIVLCHLKDRDQELQIGDSTEKRTIYEPLLQGASKDNIYNDFDLIGLMKTELVGTEQVRGISFDPTPTFPFLKDHYALPAPGDKRLGRRFWPITMHDGTKGEGDPESFVEINYGRLQAAMLDGLEGLEEGGPVEELPEAGLPSAEGVQPPTAGGPVAGATAVPTTPPPVKAPAKKAAPAKAVAPAKVTGTVAQAPGGPRIESEPSTPRQDIVPDALAKPGDVVGDPMSGQVDGVKAQDGTVVPQTSQEGVPGGGPGGSSAAAGDAQETVTEDPAGVDFAAVQEAQDGVAVSEPEQPAEASVQVPGTDVPQDAATQAALTEVAEQLGGQVVGVTDAADMTKEEGHCPICGKSMANEQPDLVQLSRLKHRTLVLPDGRKFYETGGCCYDDYQALNKQKVSGTGLYA